MIEASYEFAVCTFECVFGIYSIESCRIYDAEHHVAEFSFDVVDLSCGYGFFCFGDFFFYLFPYLMRFFPIETGIGRFFLYTESLHECRKC